MAVKTLTLTKSGEDYSFDKDLPAIISSLRNGRYIVTIAREDEPRSIEQNALMWMWFACISEETYTPIQDVHDYYCSKFLRKHVDWNGTQRTVVEGTRNLSKSRMSTFLDSIKADALTEFGIKLPLPEERIFEPFYQEYRQ